MKRLPWILFGLACVGLITAGFYIRGLDRQLNLARENWKNSEANFEAATNDMEKLHQTFEKYVKQVGSRVNMQAEIQSVLDQAYAEWTKCKIPWKGKTRTDSKAYAGKIAEILYFKCPPDFQSAWTNYVTCYTRSVNYGFSDTVLDGLNLWAAVHGTRPDLKSSREEEEMQDAITQLRLICAKHNIQVVTE